MQKPKCQSCQAEAKVFIKIKESEALVGYCDQHALVVGSKNLKRTFSSANTLKPLSCPHCQSVFDSKTLKHTVGCVQCYDTFSEYLKPILARFHKNFKHVGKIPRRVLGLAQVQENLGELNRELGELVQEECFQDATLVKNSIKDFTDLMEELLNSSEQRP